MSSNLQNKPQSIEYVDSMKYSILNILLDYYDSYKTALNSNIDSPVIEFFTDKYIQGVYLVRTLQAFPVIVLSFDKEPNLISSKYLYTKLELLGYYYDSQFKDWKKITEKVTKKLW